MRGVISGDVADSVAAGCRALDQILAVLASGPCRERHVAGSASGTQTRFEILQGEIFHIELFSLTGDEGSYRLPWKVRLFALREEMFSAEKWQVPNHF